MNRRSLLALIAAVAVFAAIIGWLAGQRIKSPADVAAESKAPEPSLITVPVEERVLSSNVVLRGQVEFSQSTELTVSAGVSGAAIITRLPLAVGDAIEEGSVAVEVAGRPVLVLEGALPMFRSFTPQLEGPDVRQLEDALVRLGLDPGTVDGVYDTATESAIVELYRRAGYSANQPSADDLERIQQARSGVRAAQASVTEAEQAASQNGVPRSTRLELDRAVANAETALAETKAARTIAMDEAAAAVVKANAALVEANEAATAAAERLAAAEAGTHPDTGQPPTDAELAVLRAAVTETSEALPEATTAAEAAAATKTSIEREQNLFVNNAATDLEIAKASRSETLASTSSSSSLISQARESLQEQQQVLNRLEAEVGVTVPVSEMVFLPTLPAEVQAVRVEVGADPQGPVMTVTGAGVRITSTVSAADRSLLAEGNEAIMEDADLGLSIPAKVTFVADDPGGVEVAEDRYRVRLEPIGDLPEDAIGQNLRVTIPFASTDGAVLAVPMAALSSGADGSARVEVERGGNVEIIRVSPGLNARAVGLVEITPLESTLSAGDRVVVGRNNPDADADSGSSSNDDGSDNDGSSDGGTSDGGTSDGGTSDGGTSDGGDETDE